MDTLVMYIDPTGEITWSQVGTIAIYAAITAAVIGLTILTLGAGSAVVIGTVAAIGFGTGAVTSIATQLLFNHSVDIGQVILDGLTGSTTACVSMLPIGALGIAAFGGIIGSGSYVGSSKYNGTEITPEGLGAAIVIGFAAGLISGPGRGYDNLTKYNFVSGMAESLISPKKIIMYSVKAFDIYNQMAVSAVRFAASVVFFEGVYTAYQNGELRIDFGGR